LQGRTVHTSFPADLALVSVDAPLIHQLLINLLENALRYTPQTSSLYVSARETPAAVAVEFADDGPGISEAEREKVFEKFYRGGQAAKGDGGVGLGLTICRAVVRAHGGYIVIRGRPGGGAVVEFTLPRAEERGRVVPAEEPSS
jgi:two-component system sensor histidine kinase KdpD